MMYAGNRGVLAPEPRAAKAEGTDGTPRQKQPTAAATTTMATAAATTAVAAAEWGGKAVRTDQKRGLLGSTTGTLLLHHTRVC